MAGFTEEDKEKMTRSVVESMFQRTVITGLASCPAVGLGAKEKGKVKMLSEIAEGLIKAWLGD